MTVLDNLIVSCQEHYKWCWASVGAAISNFYHPSHKMKQCDVAEKVIPMCQCCKDGASACCNQDFYLESVLSRLGFFVQPVIFKAADNQTIVQSIVSQKPLCARIQFASGGHFVAIRGFSYSGSGTLYLMIGDPETGDCVVTYDEFKSKYRGAGKWDTTYFTSR